MIENEGHRVVIERQDNKQYIGAIISDNGTSYGGFRADNVSDVLVKIADHLKKTDRLHVVLEAVNELPRSPASNMEITVWFCAYRDVVEEALHLLTEKVI